MLFSFRVRGMHSLIAGTENPTAIMVNLARMPVLLPNATAFQPSVVGMNQLKTSLLPLYRLPQHRPNLLYPNVNLLDTQNPHPKGSPRTRGSAGCVGRRFRQG